MASRHSVPQAACVYSLTRPLRTGIRRICRASRSVPVRRGTSGSSTRARRLLQRRQQPPSISPRPPREPTHQGELLLIRQKAPSWQQVGPCASKRPSAGGNIGGRRRADLVAQDFDLYGWRCACCGLGDVAAAQHTARSCSAEMPRRVACTAGFGTIASPRDSRSCACPATSPRARANGARSHIDSKKRCYACNEIKLLVKEFGTDRTAHDGHARAARCATPQPEQ